MRSNDFPITIEVDGTVYGPAMLASFDEVTQVWAHIDGEARVVATGPALERKERVAHGLRMSDGRRARWAAVLVDGTSWNVGHHAHCCSCNKHPLCGNVPPEPAAAEPESIEVNA